MEHLSPQVRSLIEDAMNNIDNLPYSVKASVHDYEDDVRVTIFTLDYDCYDNDVPRELLSLNGLRVFHTILTNEHLATFPGYKIKKIVVNSRNISDDPELVLAEVLGNEQVSAYYPSSDGTLLLLFKVRGAIRPQYMRSAIIHNEEERIGKIQEEFCQSPSTIEDSFFNSGVVTSTKCHLFRFTDTTAMDAPTCTKVFYTGDVQCDVNDLVTKQDSDLINEITTKTRMEYSSVIDILKKSQPNVLCIRSGNGEIQLLNEDYVTRLSGLTGVQIRRLVNVPDVREDEEEKIGPRTGSSFLPFHIKFGEFYRSRAPKFIDLLALISLAGVGTGEPSQPIAKIGFRSELRNDKIVAFPQRPFYRYCYNCGVNPRSVLAFPADPIQMHEATGRMYIKCNPDYLYWDAYERVDRIMVTIKNLARTLVHIFKAPPSAFQGLCEAVGADLSTIRPPPRIPPYNQEPFIQKALYTDLNPYVRVTLTRLIWRIGFPAIFQCKPGAIGKLLVQEKKNKNVDE